MADFAPKTAGLRETSSPAVEADKPSDDQIPAIFATIHFRSPERPNGYTPEDIAELNRLANRPREQRR